MKSVNFDTAIMISLIMFAGAALVDLGPSGSAPIVCGRFPDLVSVPEVAISDTWPTSFAKEAFYPHAPVSKIATPPPSVDSVMAGSGAASAVVKGRVVRVGDVVDGFKVARIDSHGVQFERSEKSVQGKFKAANQVPDSKLESKPNLVVVQTSQKAAPKAGSGGLDAAFNRILNNIR